MTTKKKAVKKSAKKQVSGATKAVQTRNRRKAFINRYGMRTAHIIRYLLGCNDWDVEITALNTSLTSLAAYNANLTRGTYDRYLNRGKW